MTCKIMNTKILDYWNFNVILKYKKHMQIYSSYLGSEMILKQCFRLHSNVSIASVTVKPAEFFQIYIYVGMAGTDNTIQQFQIK